MRNNLPEVELTKRQTKIQGKGESAPRRARGARRCRWLRPCGKPAKPAGDRRAAGWGERAVAICKGSVPVRASGWRAPRRPKGRQEKGEQRSSAANGFLP